MSSLNDLADNELQAALLEGVSRTFALTIPQLPEPLCHVVSNAYLLCRIVDTVEDEVALTAGQKHKFCEQFIAVVAEAGDADLFARQLAPLLSDQTLAAEHELIQLTSRVIDITRSFDQVQREALATCVTVMANGMPNYQDQDLKQGLATMSDMDTYCYHVAGCVGEMLAKLFCHYSEEIAENQQQLLKLSVSFGQGLQMTNILKDIWDDQQRGVCWLPQDIFAKHGFQLGELAPEHHGEAFRQGLQELVCIAHDHLHNALTYTLLIPKQETGIRNFCLWALGMAVLTIRKVGYNLDFTDSSQVKISRRSVKATILATRLTGSNDWMLEKLFQLASIGIAKPDAALINNHNHQPQQSNN